MEQISVLPIPSRDWAETKSSLDLVFERDIERKRNPQKMRERLYYCWFHYLKLCLNLEDMKYDVVKVGRGGKRLGKDGKDLKKRVKVNRKIYKSWDLDEVRSNIIKDKKGNDKETNTFSKWYENPKHQKLFADGRFTYSRGSQYHSLLKRFSVFIEYHNKMNSDYDDEDSLISSGRNLKKLQLCEDIIMKLKTTKVRYEQVEGDRKNPTKTKGNRKSFQSLVLNDINLCEDTILAVCGGSFPKPSV
jgi:hypothetical protein